MSSSINSPTNTPRSNAPRVNPPRLDLPWFRGPNFNYEADERTCYCIPPLRAPMWFSWTDKNPGRRFFACSKHPHGEKCDYFEWYDDELSPRSVDIISGLRKERTLYRNELRRFLAHGCESCTPRILAQENEIRAMMSELTQYEKLITFHKRKILLMKVLLGFSWIVFFSNMWTKCFNRFSM